jgi:hypothetical protein
VVVILPPPAWAICEAGVKLYESLPAIAQIAPNWGSRRFRPRSQQLAGTFSPLTPSVMAMLISMTRPG